MDYAEYRKRGKEMVDYIADYLENIRERRVFPAVKPGYLRELVPDAAPPKGETWNDIFKDIERVIMPGVTHWQSPYMHAYFPALNSPASLLGDMLADAIGCLGFTWASSPACTELESLVMDWLGKMIGLPNEFLHTCKTSAGGGVIQTTASEATFVALLAGRTEMFRKYKAIEPDTEEAEINSRLVAYCSDQAHSSVEKAGLISLVKMRYVESDDDLSMGGAKLYEAVQRDREKGLIPFWVCCTLGTTGACAFDKLKEIGPICQKEGLWLHIDAAYAGTAFICPEFRHWLVGVEYADSLAFNPSKRMMVHFDCTAMWVKNSEALHRTFNVEPLYLQHENSGLAIDYMHWQISLSKKFRALKLWFVIRNFGVEGLQQHVRKGVYLAKSMEAFILADQRFEVPVPCNLGMVVFRLKGENELTERLLKTLNSAGKLHCVPAALKGKYVIRFTVTSTHTTLDDIKRDWSIIQNTAAQILTLNGIIEDPDVKTDKPASRKENARVPLKETKKSNFGTSLLLANSPMSPKIVNGSFAAIFDQGDFLFEIAKKIAQLKLNQGKGSPAVGRRIRGMLVSSNKQYSLDSRMDLVETIVNAPSNLESALVRESDGEVSTSPEEEEWTDNRTVYENGHRRYHRSQSIDANTNHDMALRTTNVKGKPSVVAIAEKEEAYGSSESENEKEKAYCKHCGRHI
ncbi:histidine decarboxylase-like [Artemia franciscana]|uniref:Histidine decarboxylase n=1 Tax=Artemia franciscana TaxID=6661 RepID=A0AA88L5A0_ARTSF|nr:hypothetical protein QYM36_006208 [Artemia franciscana]